MQNTNPHKWAGRGFSPTCLILRLGSETNEASKEKSY